MKRREFITLLGGAAVAWPVTASAQQPNPVRRIGVLMGIGQSDPEGQSRVMALRQGLEQLNLKDGQNLSSIAGARAMPVKFGLTRQNFWR